MVSKKQSSLSSLSVRVGQLSQVELAVRRAVRGRGPVVALGALSLLAAAFAAPVLAADAAADSENNKSSNSSQSDDKLQQVVVTTARREAIQSADQLKKNSESIIDSVNADDAGKLPDASITEVLQRIPGVTITRYSGDADHFQAQGTGIQVRGLSGVAGRVNGREVFSANGGNGLNWSDIPPELMAGVDVYKAATADLIEGGTGGQVDLRTKMPFDFHGFGAQLSGNADYADFRKKTSPTGSALLTDTWETEHLGRIGILVDYSYGKYASRDDFIRQDPLYKTRIGDVDRYIPGGVAYGRETFDRTRKGQYAALQWRPTDNFELSQTYWESKYQQTNTAQGVTMTSTTFAVDPNGNNVFDAAGALLKTDNLFLYNPANLGVPTLGELTPSRRWAWWR